MLNASHSNKLDLEMLWQEIVIEIVKIVGLTLSFMNIFLKRFFFNELN